MSEAKVFLLKSATRETGHTDVIYYNSDQLNMDALNLCDDLLGFYIVKENQ